MNYKAIITLKTWYFTRTDQLLRQNIEVLSEKRKNLLLDKSDTEMKKLSINRIEPTDKQFIENEN